MKTIAVSVDDETYRLFRVRAARLGLSVSALVRRCLKSFVVESAGENGSDGRVRQAECERRRQLLNEVFADFDARGAGLRMADNLPRDALYSRDALR